MSKIEDLPCCMLLAQAPDQGRQRGCFHRSSGHNSCSSTKRCASIKQRHTYQGVVSRVALFVLLIHMLFSSAQLGSVVIAGTEIPMSTVAAVEQQSTDEVVSEGTLVLGQPHSHVNGVSATIKANYVNFRHGPGLDYDIYGQLRLGTPIQVLAYYGNWYNVRTPQGTIGWVAIHLVNISAADARTVPLANNVPSPAPAEQILWSADHEVGDMSRWWHPGGMNHCGGEFNSGTGISGATTTVAHGGRYAARLAITNTTSGQQGVRLFRWCEAQRNAALYYSAWYYFPQRVEGMNDHAWWSVMEWKSRTSSTNAPIFMLNVVNRPDGQMALRLFDWRTRISYNQQVVNIPVGRWVHIEGYYKKAMDTSGQVTIWQDGVQILDVRNVSTAVSDDLHWAVINYGDRLNPSDVTIYVDDAVISTRRIGP